MNDLLIYFISRLTLAVVWLLQYVAEYLRLHLFKNTVEKIRQLRTTMNGVVEPGKAASNSEKRPSLNSTTTTNITRSDSSKSNKDVSLDKAVKDKTNENIKQTSDIISLKSEEKTDDSMKSSNSPIVDTSVTEPLKKDDAYNTLNIRKKSLANIMAAASTKGEKTDEASLDDTQQYVDMNKNINLRPLLLTYNLGWFQCIS